MRDVADYQRMSKQAWDGAVALNEQWLAEPAVREVVREGMLVPIEESLVNELRIADKYCRGDESQPMITPIAEWTLAADGRIITADYGVCDRWVIGVHTDGDTHWLHAVNHPAGTPAGNAPLEVTDPDGLLVAVLALYGAVSM